MFDFDSAPDRRETDSIKWRKYENQDIIPMWVADMDFKSPPAVVEALEKRIAHGVFGYGKIRSQLTEAVIHHLWDAYQWDVKPGWIVWLPGLVSGLNVACRSVGQTGSSIVTTVPVYPPFLSAPGFSRRKLITTPMVQSQSGWVISVEDLEGCLTDQSALFILCNPHNPTGRVFDHNELTRLAEVCLGHDVVICSDEIHCDLILEPGCRHVPIATLSPEVAQHTITLMAPSKTYNIPGLSCAFAVVSNARLRRRFTQAMAGIVPHVNVLGMAATQAAYQKGQKWLSALLTYLRDNRNLVQQAINQINRLHLEPIQGTYLAWIDTRRLHCADPVRHFESYGVGLSDGKAFHGPGFVRLNFGCSQPLLSEALKRIERAANALPAR